MKFIAGFKKAVNAIEGVDCDSIPPTYWTTSGCVVLNKVLGGNFNRALGQGRILGLVGPSGCLPADEEVTIYVMKSLKGHTPIINE